MSSQEHDGLGTTVSVAAPASASEPILIPLMCRVASVIEYLKTHLGSSETHVNLQIATAVSRLENAMVHRSVRLMIQHDDDVLQARAGVKEIDLRLGDPLQPNIHRVGAFTPIADVGQQIYEECK